MNPNWSGDMLQKFCKSHLDFMNDYENMILQHTKKLTK